MEINKVSTPQTVATEIKKQPEKVKDTGLKKDSFKKELETFEPESARKFLENAKSSDGNPKLKHDYYKDTILENVTKNPEIWPYFKELFSRDHLSQSYLLDCSEKSVEDVKTLVEYSAIKDSKDEYRYRPSHLNKILTFDPATRNNVKVLSNTELLADNIIQAVQEKGLDCNKVASKSNEMTDFIGRDNLSELKFTRDEYAKGCYKLIGKKKDGNSFKEYLDNKMDRYAFEAQKSYKSENGQEYVIQKSTDLRNNTTSKTRYTKQGELGYVATHEVRIIKDAGGKVKRTEYIQPSEISGIRDIKYVYPNGKTEIISSGTVDKKTGITTIKKNMVSSLGTKTEYLFEDDPQGNRISDYKITDKKGKVLLQNSQSFEVIDKNHFISSKNDQKYEIIADEAKHSVTVKDLNNPERTATFTAQKEIFGKYEEMIKVLKKMPGEELFKLKEDTSKLYGIEDVLESYSLTDTSTREIHTGDNLFVILHELGHAVDMKDVDMMQEKETIHKAIFEDKKFNQIYEKEKAAFNKAFPNAQRDHIDYFINHETHYNGEIGGRKETIAEANALLTTAKTHEVLAMRSQYLQQHFPETIAYLDKKLAEPAENPNRTYSSSSYSGWSGH